MHDDQRAEDRPFECGEGGCSKAFSRVSDDDDDGDELALPSTAGLDTARGSECTSFQRTCGAPSGTGAAELGLHACARPFLC